jgi:energy-coupling factor transporter ATP-binding protein EcfA2
MHPDVIVTDRTKSSGVFRLISNPTRWAVIKDRGHHLGFSIQFFHADSAHHPVHAIRTEPNVRWAEASRLAAELLTSGEAFNAVRQSPLPLGDSPASIRHSSSSDEAPQPNEIHVAVSDVQVTPAANKLPTHHVQSVRIQRFKRISDASFDLAYLTVLVGGNNSGKSSIIQALHFGVALLQSLALSNQWKASTLNPNQLIYSPSDDIYALGAGGRLVQDPAKAISLDFVLASGDTCGLDVSKGKNRNISVAIRNPTVASQLSSLQLPFSIFSPGLAGIAKQETYVSDGVLLRTLARGDANLILRNILYRLSTNKATWSAFLDDLTELFPSLDILFAYTPSTSEFIDVKVQYQDTEVPLELAGTSVLQAAQILSYIHHFAPSMVVLDEPDSHLHPNNQRLLCGLLRRLSNEQSTQILLTTHSRHVVDALENSASFLWVRNGTIDIASADDELAILIDIGALDIKERVGVPSTTTAVVLTEDETTRPLELILESSGFNMTATTVLPYYGVTGIKELRPLVHVIRSQNPSAKIVLHRDRDFLVETEIEEWKKGVRQLGVEPFVTVGRDIEASFINAKHLSQLNGDLKLEEFQELITGVLNAEKEELVKDYVNGRVEIARRERTSPPNMGALAVEAFKAVESSPMNYAGKRVLRAIRSTFRNKYARNLRTDAISESLADPFLTAVAGKVPYPKSH